MHFRKMHFRTQALAAAGIISCPGAAGPERGAAGGDRGARGEVADADPDRLRAGPLG